MADFGLILGGALAGGLEDAGKAGVASMQQEQKTLDSQDLLNTQAQLEEQKDLRIAEANHDYRSQELQQNFAHQDTTLQSQQAFAGAQGAANRQAEEDVANIHSSAELQAAQIAANASMSNAALLSANKTIQTLGDGRIVSIGRDTATGQMTATPLMDPMNPSKPLMGVKNLDQREIVLAKSYMDEGNAYRQLGDIDNAQKMYESGRDILNGKTPGGPAVKVASPAQIALLMKNPSLAPQFDAVFGKGQAAALLSMANGQTATPASGASAATPASGTDTGASTGTPGVPPLPPDNSSFPSGVPGVPSGTVPQDPTSIQAGAGTFPSANPPPLPPGGLVDSNVNY